jgi:hypothetical protein
MDIGMDIPLDGGANVWAPSLILPVPSYSQSIYIRYPLSLLVTMVSIYLFTSCYGKAL